jgi:hypothetical protein
MQNFFFGFLYTSSSSHWRGEQKTSKKKILKLNVVCGGQSVHIWGELTESNKLVSHFSTRARPEDGEDGGTADGEEEAKGNDREEVSEQEGGRDRE